MDVSAEAMADHRTYGRLTLVGDRWVMTEIPPHVAIRLKAVFPRIEKSETRAFKFNTSHDVCADLEWFLGRYPMEMSSDDRAKLMSGRGQFEALRADIESIMLPTWVPPQRTGFRYPNELYAYQSQAVEIAQRLNRLLLLDDLGLGKTVTALGVLASGMRLPAAIVVQSHMPSQWVKEFIQPFTYLTSHVVKGTKPYSLPQADIYVFKYSNLAGWSDIAATGMFKSVVFDEAQELRHGTNTAKGRAARVFADSAVLRMGLTGTPIYNYGSEIFHVVGYIEPGALGDWPDFLREWCTGRNGKWVVKDPDALGTYLRELHLVLRRERQGRPVNTLPIEVEHDEQVQAEAEDLARALALKVVTGSFTERGQAARELDSFARLVTGVSKAKSVAGYVRMLLKTGTPVILAGWHRDVYDIWLKELAEFKPRLYTGSESPKQKDDAKAAFISGETDLLIISLRSGVGLDGLQRRCSTVVFGELDWSPKVHEQLIGRVDRPGQQEKEVTAIYLYTNSGSDPTVMSVLGLKASQSRGIVTPMAGIQPVYSDESRIKKLAEQYLRTAS